MASWNVYVGGRMVRVDNKRTPGAAARAAFRVLIREKHIKRQPPADPDTGGWKGVSIEVVKGSAKKAAA